MRLNELSESAGGSVADARWNNLNNRLSDKRKKAFPFVYWLAAASVLFLVAIIIFNRDKSLPADIQKPLVLIKPTVKELPSKIIVNASPVVKRTEKSSAPKKPVAVNVIVEETHTAPQQEIVAVVIPDTASKTAEVITAKPVKQMKVVHINDLVSEQDTPSETFTSNTKAAKKILRETKREKFRRTWVANSATGDLIKIKLSPSN
ncbi:MAG: hypothetical protein H7Y27_16825 [Gemmatimonadaceae bacterium]|nr:hypothetical protein [Chitinophagaceae bacterium]